MTLGKTTSSEGKQRIAFFGSGVGLPAEQGAHQGLPLMVTLLERLVLDYDIVIYSLIRVKPDHVPDGITLRQITSLPFPLYVKYFLLIVQFATDHTRRSFGVINAISAYPAGRIAMILGRVFGRPVFVHLIGSEAVAIAAIGYGDLLIRRLNKIVKSVCRKADVLITLSDYQRKLVEGNLGLSGKAHVLPRMPDLRKFNYCERSVSFPVKLLHVASHQQVKDQGTLLRAVAAISKKVDCTLTMVGLESNSIRQLARQLGIEERVKFAGIVPYTDVSQYFLEAHVLLHTSIYESLGAVVLEAMASGLPVCATNVGVVSDLGPPLVVAVPVGQSEELARETLRLIHDVDRYREQQRMARKYMEDHGADWAAKNYKAVLEKWIE